MERAWVYVYVDSKCERSPQKKHIYHKHRKGGDKGIYERLSVYLSVHLSVYRGLNQLLTQHQGNLNYKHIQKFKCTYINTHYSLLGPCHQEWC